MDVSFWSFIDARVNVYFIPVRKAFVMGHQEQRKLFAGRSELRGQLGAGCGNNGN